MPAVNRAVLAGFLAVLFFLHFWGVPFDGFHFSDFHFYSPELPLFWGLSVVDPGSGWLNWELLFHNEGLMALFYWLLHEAPLATEDKVYLVNGTTLALQAVDAVLLLCVLRRLVGPARLAPFALVYLLYPFASANRYWQACIANHLAALLFLISLLCFLCVDYDPHRVRRNLGCWIVPSLAFLWLSIITVEFAVFLSPVYVLLAVYHSNGRKLSLAGPWRSSPYPALACLFLLTSLLPVALFTGHNLTVFSYATRYRELASSANAGSLAVATGAILGNGALVFLSVLFANTLGVVLYPLAELIEQATRFAWRPSAAEVAGIAAATGLGLAMFRPAGRGKGGGAQPHYRFLVVLGLAWALLAYLPFSLSYGYPRNVGPVADRINLLGSMGVALCLGAFVCLVQDRLAGGSAVGSGFFYAACSAVLVLLLAHLQVQKAIYVEAERKERAIIDAVLDARAGLSPGAKEPIFLLRRDREFVPPRVQLRRALGEPSVPGRLVAVGRVLLRRYFLDPPVPTGFHLEGIYWFWSKAFEFYADLGGKPRPIVYRYEEPFQLVEDAETYRLGYRPREVWDDPADGQGFRAYPKARYELVLVRIAEHSFRFGRSLDYALLPYQPEQER